MYNVEISNTINNSRMARSFLIFISYLSQPVYYKNIYKILEKIINEENYYSILLRHIIDFSEGYKFS